MIRIQKEKKNPSPALPRIGEAAPEVRLEVEVCGLDAAQALEGLAEEHDVVEDALLACWRRGLHVGEVLGHLAVQQRSLGTRLEGPSRLPTTPTRHRLHPL